MADTYTFEIKAKIDKLKKDLKETKEETKSLKDNFGAFGITIGSVKEKFGEMRKIMKNGLKEIIIQAQLAGQGFKMMFSGKVITGAKVLFSAIKTGIAATGIGLLVVAFGSLAVWFKNTKVGAEALEVIFSKIGATVKVITDRISKFGSSLSKVFTDPKAAWKGMKESFKGIGDEIKNDIELADNLTRAFQRLRDNERELNVETAQRRSDIEQLKLIAEDVTKSTEVRLKAAKDAFVMEQELLDKRLENAQAAVDIQRQQNAMGESMEEDLDALAEKEINLANIRGESVTKQIELNNKINALKTEHENKRLEAIKKEEETRKAADEERKRLAENQLLQAVTGMDKIENYRQEINLLKEEDETERAKLALIYQEKNAQEEIDRMDIDNYTKVQLKEQVAEKFRIINKQMFDNQKKWSEMEMKTKLSITQSTFANLSTIMGKESKAGKAFAAASTIIATYQSAVESYKSLSGIPIVGPALGGIAAAAAVVSGMNNVKAIYATNPGSSGGAAGGGSMGGRGGTPPAPKALSGAFTIGGGGEIPDPNDPVKAYVVSDEITDQQDKDATIRRRATI